jgi:hypothetical protein
MLNNAKMPQDLAVPPHNHREARDTGGGRICFVWTT